jgi:hypothetical protein
MQIISVAIVQSYLNANNLSPVFSILLYERTLTEVRDNLLHESIHQYRTHLLQGAHKSDELSYIIKLHAMQLDLISKLFMLLEDYLRNSLVDLPKSIAADKMGVAKAEINYLEQICEEDIADYLLFRNIDELNLNISDKEFVNKHLKSLSEDVHKRIKKKKLVSVMLSYRIVNNY